MGRAGKGGLTAAEEARCLNVIGDYVARRDVPALTRAALAEAGVSGGVADVAVLFGGSIVAGGDTFAEAMRAGVARTYVIVGGAGHTTATLRERMRELCPGARFADDAPEADVFSVYLLERHGLSADLLERHSTNSGNNVTMLFELLRAHGIEPASAVLIQDATMQRRLGAIARLREPGVRVLNYAAYRVRVVARDGRLAYAEEPVGMWDVDRYRALLMGEVPRLRDDEEGYGPRGAGFIAHVDVPDEVEWAWELLRAAHPGDVRAANPAYARPRG